MMLLLLLCVCDAEDFVEDVADAPGDVAASVAAATDDTLAASVADDDFDDDNADDDATIVTLLLLSLHLYKYAFEMSHVYFNEFNNSDGQFPSLTSYICTPFIFCRAWHTFLIHI